MFTKKALRYSNPATAVISGLVINIKMRFPGFVQCQCLTAIENAGTFYAGLVFGRFRKKTNSRFKTTGLFFHVCV
jgi:hypothetical protein